MRVHSPPVVRANADFGAPAMTCNTCHGPSNVTFDSGEKSIPGHDPWLLAPASMGWQGLSLAEQCEHIKDTKLNGNRDLEGLYKHMATDTLVGWAWDPGKGRRPAPGNQKIFAALIRAWINTGAVCPVKG